MKSPSGGSLTQRPKGAFAVSWRGQLGKKNVITIYKEETVLPKLFIYFIVKLCLLAQLDGQKTFCQCFDRLCTSPEHSLSKR